MWFGRYPLDKRGGSDEQELLLWVITIALLVLPTSSKKYVVGQVLREARMMTDWVYRGLAVDLVVKEN